MIIRVSTASLAALFLFLASAACAQDNEILPVAAVHQGERRPNVIVVLTDDQGYGDLACHGNPILQTPHLDKLYRESVRFANFHVAPMCTPTRGQLITGLDALRNRATGVDDGHHLLRRGLRTMADVFSAGGYATGLFGKWHLGDTWPYRPQDRGFQEVMTFRGWGLAGISELFNDYTDGHYIHNGVEHAFPGYATDFWFAEATKWMKARIASNEPFFCYLPLNAAHRPAWIDAAAISPYEGKGLDDQTAGFFAQISNIDENLGRLDAFLRNTGIRDNTILVFLSDNGSAHSYKFFNAGMRGGKARLYEGGHRVPCFLRWPRGGIEGGRDIEEPTEVQDLLPTLATLAGLTELLPAQLDGIDLTPALRQGKPLKERMLVVQFGYNSSPLRAGKACVIWNRWRLVNSEELFRLDDDPGQNKNLINEYPEVAARMRAFYEQWLAGVGGLPLNREPNIIAPSHQDPVRLSGSEMAGAGTATDVILHPKAMSDGDWAIDIAESGRYRVRLSRWPLDSDLPLDAPLPGYVHTGGYRPWPRDWHMVLQAIPSELADGLRRLPPAGLSVPIRKAKLEIGYSVWSSATPSGTLFAEFEVELAAGPQKMRAWFEGANGEPLCQAFYLEFMRQ